MSNTRCRAEAEYCGERLCCEGKNPCRNYHSASSVRFGYICWNEEKRPQPAKMFHAGGMGIQHGSYEADANILAAATMADAVNRLEHLLEQRPLSSAIAETTTTPKGYWR